MRQPPKVSVRNFSTHKIENKNHPREGIGRSKQSPCELKNYGRKLSEAASVQIHNYMWKAFVDRESLKSCSDAILRYAPYMRCTSKSGSYIVQNTQQNCISHACRSPHGHPDLEEVFYLDPDGAEGSKSVTLIFTRFRGGSGSNYPRVIPPSEVAILRI